MRPEIFLADPDRPLAQSYLILGDRPNIAAALIEILSRRLDRPLTDYPDYRSWLKDKLTITDSRQIRNWLALKAVDPADRKFLLISVSSWLREAQNALLKALEEPAGRSHIFLLADSAGQILPTLRSRCQILTWPAVRPVAADQAITEFLAASVFDRLAGLRAGRWPGLIDSPAELGENLSRLEVIGLADIRQKQKPTAAWSAVLELKRDHHRTLNLPARLVWEYLAIYLPVGQTPST